MLNTAKSQVISMHALGREVELIEKYIVDGPKSLKKALKLDDSQWATVFDYLVFDHNLLYKCVTHSRDFFMDVYVRDGMAGVRDILGVNDSKYDRLCEAIFDFLAVANEGIAMHVLHNREKYAKAIRARSRDFVRKVLGLYRKKYDDTWAQVLDILLHTVCDGLFAEQNYERGLECFSRIVNDVREHKPIVKHKFI